MIENIRLKPALCIDWNSTIRRSKSGATTIKDLGDIELIPGVEGILWRYKEMDYCIIALGNENDHGYKPPFEIQRELDVTMALFSNNPLDLVNLSFCGAKEAPEPFNHRSLCRFPDYGMLSMAEFNAFHVKGVIIDWSKSLLVGDRPEHEQCAKNAGVAFRTTHSFFNEPHTFEL
jgi:histidinol phosphatase-like enzyme